MRRGPQGDAERRARDAELRQIRDATAAMRGLTRTISGSGGAIAALGGLAQGGPLAAALGVVTFAVEEMRRLQERAVRESGNIIRAQVATGGSSRDIAQTAAEFRAIGLDSGRIAEIADEFRERLFNDPVAIGAFGRQVLPERLGGIENSIAVLREGLAILGRETTETGRRIRAARFQIPRELLQVFDIPPEQRERLLRATEEQASQIDPELRRLRAQSESIRIRRELAEEKIKMDQERVGLRYLNDFHEREARDAEFRARGGALGWLRRRMRGQSEEASATAKTDAQTTAVQENTKALYNLKDEFANSRRASGAVPAGLRGMALQEALNEMGALPYWLGAYSQH